MRLVDMVIQAPRVDAIANQPNIHITGAGSFADKVATCGLRYILDRRASRQCADVFMGDREAPPLGDDILRLPGRLFWIELFCDGDELELHGVATGRRIGYLVEAAEDGRSGRIVSFAENALGQAQLVPGSVSFDLDLPPPSATMSRRCYRMRHGDVPRVDHMLEHARFEIGEEWTDIPERAGIPLRDWVAQQAEFAWCGLPLIFGFSALKNSRGVLNERKSSLDKLNASRKRVGRPALLDHVEISLNLTPVHGDRSRRAVEGDRRSPVLHFVRGHQVCRRGSTFWRSSHYRGVGTEPRTKTFTVTSKAPVLNVEMPAYN